MGINEEILSLLLFYSLAVGVFLGALWDFFRIFRIICYGRQMPALPCPVLLPSTQKEVSTALSFNHRHKFFSAAGITVFISDLLFCITAAFSVIILLFHLNGGEIRVLALFGAGIGFTVYYFTVGKLTLKISDAVINKVKKFIFFVISEIIAPVFRFLTRPLAFLLRKIKKSLDKIKNKFKIKKRSTISPDNTGVKNNIASKSTEKRKKDAKNERNKIRNHCKNGKGAVFKGKRYSSRGHGGKNLRSL